MNMRFVIGSVIAKKKKKNANKLEIRNETFCKSVEKQVAQTATNGAAHMQVCMCMYVN